MATGNRFRINRRGFMQGAVATAAVVSTGRRAFAQSRTMTMGIAGVDLQYLTPYVAKSGNHFRDAGIEVEFIDTQSGPRTRQALAAGQVLVGLSAAADSPALTIAGRRSSIIFGVDRKMSWANILVRKEDVESGAIKSLADLSGKVVACTQPKSASEATIRYLLDRAGVNDAEIRAAGSIATAFATLKSKQVDASFAPLLNLDQATQVEGWGAALFSVGDDAAWNEVVGGEAPGVACYILENSLHERTDDLRAYVSAMVKAHDFIMQNDVKTVGDVVFDDFFPGFDRAAFDRALTQMKVSVYSTTNIIDAEAYERMLTVMRLGELQTPEELAHPDVAYDRAVSFDFVREARG
jgi:NitT/TauT family transport system substrate-binding protein